MGAHLVMDGIQDLKMLKSESPSNICVAGKFSQSVRWSPPSRSTPLEASHGNPGVSPGGEETLPSVLMETGAGPVSQCLQPPSNSLDN